MSTYLERLTRSLTSGAARLPAEQRERHARYLLASQRPDGGFAGREGDSDLYYTGFALRALALLDVLHGEPAERAAKFLAGRLGGQAQIIDFLSLIYGALLLQTTAGVDPLADADPNWPEAVYRTMTALRREDGGFVKTQDSSSSSTYHSFLVALCLELIGRPLEDPASMIAFLKTRRRDDGGFVEIAPMRRSGTNPTAAAVGLWNMLGVVDPDVRESVLDFLAEMQSDEGGIKANTRIPLADVLSTFTGLVTASDLGEIEAVDLKAARRFVQSMECPTGGFHMAVLDPAVDVEYTFYGLGSLALLALQEG